MRQQLTRKQKLIVCVICFLVLLIVFFFSFSDRNKRYSSLLAHKKFTTAVLAKIKHGRGSDFMNISIQYSLTIDGKLRTYYQYANWNIVWDSLTGKSFPVVYDTTAPEQSCLLIFPEDFDAFHATFPDSLKWVLKFKK